MADEKVVFHPNPLAQLDEVLGNSVTDFVVDTDTYSPANRPQDIRYEFPERGTESHGVNDDTPTSGYFPDQVNGDPRIVTDTGHSTSLAMELVPVDPVAVYEVPHPQRSIRRYAMVTTLFGPATQYSATAFSGVDFSTVVPIAADENRVHISFVVTASFSNPAAQNNVYYAVSTDSTFQSYQVISAPVGVTTTAVLQLDNCKESFYVAVLPVVAYDSGKTVSPTLTVIQEFAAPIDHNPAEA